jgi:putative hydrolase of the HAD superfamily
MKNYDLILFDADETLFDFKKSEKEAFRNTIIEFNMEYDENHHLKIYQLVNTAIWKEFEEGLITQEKLKVERFKRLSEMLKVNFDCVLFAKTYMKHLANASFLYEDSQELIESLHKHYLLAIVTNGLKDVQDNRIRKSVISKYFKDIIVSEEVGVSKPNPKIFEYVFKSTGHIEKSKILIVGDSLTSDIQGGINFGIDTCWYNPNKIINETGIKPNYEITKLTELKNFLLTTQINLCS